MSITKFQAYKIADKLMSLKVGPESEAKIKELLADTDRRLEAYVPQEVKDFAEKFPKYVHHSNYHNVSNGSGFRVGLYSGQSLISLPGTDTGYSRVSDEDFNAFDANTKAIEEIRGNLRKVREEIVNKIKGKGVESVCKDRKSTRLNSSH